MSIRDVQLIYKIKDLLGIGVVSFIKIKEIEMVSLRIINKEKILLSLINILCYLISNLII